MSSYPFQQNNNLLYLTGFDEPESCLVIEKSSDGGGKSHLFVKENDKHSALWSGPVTGSQSAKQEFGVDEAWPITTLSRFLEDFKSWKWFHHIDENSSIDMSLLDHLRKHGKSITDIIHRLRLYKSDEEISLLKDGSRISADAFSSVMRWSVKEKVLSENSIAARMEYECRIRGATGLAYVPVVAAGSNALILHYTRNNMLANPDDLMFMDAGGKYGGYCADISRAWPLSGRFNQSQRKLYEAVLRVQQSCIAACQAWNQIGGVNLISLQYFSNQLMAEELGKLGFKNPEKAIDQLYPHSIGHFLGLDLHDCKNVSSDAPFKPGMVITIEPGLYIPPDPAYPSEFHGIGVRIEDDVVILESGCEVMTAGVPKETEAIEHLLNSES